MNIDLEPNKFWLREEIAVTSSADLYNMAGIDRIRSEESAAAGRDEWAREYATSCGVLLEAAMQARLAGL